MNVPVGWNHGFTGKQVVLHLACGVIACGVMIVGLGMLETDVYNFLGLAIIVDFNSANSCLVAMALASIANIEIAREFLLLIVVYFAWPDEVLRQPLDLLIDLGRNFGPPSTAGVSVSDLVLSAATVTLSVVLWRLRLFLALCYGLLGH